MHGDFGRLVLPLTYLFCNLVDLRIDFVEPVKRETVGTPGLGYPLLLCLGKGLVVNLVKVIGCSSLRGGGGELGSNKNSDLWLQLVCTKLKLKHAI